MDWLIFFILGGWGSGWPRDPEDYWPKWCIACRLIIGGISAIIVNMLYPMDIGTGFMTAAIISFASGYVGSRLFGDLFVRMGMTAQRG
jgi:hypothetical protein